jgi:glycosyltransferase involved in cell wall biosynthesis
MKPFFSIITPTLQRESLIHCCKSLDDQTFINWQHIIQVDAEEFSPSVISRLKQDKRRRVEKCGVHHSNFGNSCRHQAWDRAQGRWLVHLDDDNYLSDPDVLMDMAIILQEANPKWAIFPIMRHGRRFFNDPPGLCMTDTANVITRRDIGRWPDGAEYTMDGLWVERLKLDNPWAAFPEFRPIIVMEASGLGQ